jgi:hypothetical protein
VSGISGVVGEKIRECDEGNTLTMSTNLLSVVCQPSGFPNRLLPARRGLLLPTPRSRVNFGTAAGAKQCGRVKGTSVKLTTNSVADEVPLSRIHGVRVVAIEGVKIDYGDEKKD